MKKNAIIIIVISIITILIVGIIGFILYKTIIDKIAEINNIEEFGERQEENTNSNKQESNTNSNKIEDNVTNEKNPVATIEIQNYGTIKVELYKDQAPNTVTNFIRLANRGFYNNLTFHRVIKDFMIQGGDPKGDGTGGSTLKDIKDGGDSSEYSIKGEFSKNGYKNNKIKFERGVIAMARADYSVIGLEEEGYNSASSQFFIMHKDNSNLNGLYAGFGKVIDGLEVVDKIADVKISADDINGDRPENPPLIKSITVETYGADYGEPETLKPFDYNEWFMKNYQQ